MNADAATVSQVEIVEISDFQRNFNKIKYTNWAKSSLITCNKFFAESKTSLESLRQFPGVLQVFLKYNTPLPSSAPVKRLFSLAGHIHAPKRSKLSDAMFSNLVFLKGNPTFM
jgi:hypothetical protein